MASVKVAVRARPFSKREHELHCRTIVDVTDRTCCVTNIKLPVGGNDTLGRERVKNFTYDYAYWSVDSASDNYASQEQIYNDLGAEVVSSAYGGYNACVLAYGQTGSGKTYTMMGSENTDVLQNPDSLGLIPRICQNLFHQMQDEQTTYRTEVCYLEIYNERVRDLLRDDTNRQRNLRVREHPKDGPYVQETVAMSSIHRMSIQGIRSFGPDENDKQVISFFSPLTLILGANGTGKTTIIECLKYMTTGEMPPNAKTNAAFIHDPKIAMEREVKAQICLQFRDVRQQSVVATRSLTATQKSQKKTEMKTLEGTINRTNDHGVKVSISSRSAEMDREMVSLLGVSKPVLENVIFCHQEESTWPLSEGKALKQRFDDIFASTRYVKALEVTRKTKTEQMTIIRECSSEMKYLKDNKVHAAELRSQLDDREAGYMAAKESVEEVKHRLLPIENQLEKIGSKSGEINQLRVRIGELRVEKQEMEKAVQELKDIIPTEFEGSTEELQRTLSEFQEKMQDKQEELAGLERQLATLEAKMDKLGRQKSKLLLDQGKLQQEAEHQKQTVEKRDRLLAKVAQAYELDGFSGSLTTSHVQRFLRALEEKAKGILSKSNDVKAQLEVEEKLILTEKDAKASSKTKLETEKDMKAEQLKSSEGEVRNIKRKLSEVEASAGRLRDLTADLKRAELELRDVEAAVNVDTLKTEIRELADTKVAHDATLKTLDVELVLLSKEASVRSELEVHKKDKSSKEDQIHRLRAKNEDALKHLLGSMPDQHLLKTLNAYILKHSRLVKEQQGKMERLKRQQAGLEMDRKNQMEHLKKKEEEQKEHTEKIFTVCSSENLDDGMEAAQTELDNQQKILAYLKGTEHVYSRFMDKMETAHDRCPLCMQRFPSEADADELVTSMENKLSLVPSKVVDIETKLEKYKKKYEDMLQLRPIKAALLDIEREELPNLRSKVSTLNTQMESIGTEISELEDQLESAMSDEAQAKAMVTDMTMIDRYTNELKDVARKITALSAKLSPDGSGKTMQEIQQEREDIQLQLDSVTRNMDRKRSRLDEHMDQLQTLRSQVNGLGREKLQIESDLQQRSRLEKRKEELQDTIEVLMVEIDECKVQLQPLQAEMRKLQKDQDSVTAKKEQHLQTARDEFNKIKTKGKEIGSLGLEITSYVDSGKEQELLDKEAGMRDMAGQLRDLDEQKESVAASMDRRRREVAAQATQQRSLRDSLSMRRKQRDIQLKAGELGEMEEQLGGLDVSNLRLEGMRLEKERERMTREKHTAQGRLQGFEDEIKLMRKNLKAEQYVDAEMKYTNKMIDMRTTQTACEDLDKYYKALDRSIMSYHESKMREINKIIRELWTKTYKGNDIETIEIRSDDEGPATATKRRIYHYRVVMIKGEAALDMRGRCSAGQKVLACLIIRLALAETFCLNCGILALDEPTTNLDRENIESLAHALVQIISSRGRQMNFQLLIITHDEDFVELLGRSDHVEEFFKVRKTELGCSQLVKARVEDLHTR